jgi:hypothetical protein
VDWQNPHAYFFLESKNDKGVVEKEYQFTIEDSKVLTSTAAFVSLPRSRCEKCKRQCLSSPAFQILTSRRRRSAVPARFDHEPHTAALTVLRSPVV